jgi:hypothetical protein
MIMSLPECPGGFLLPTPRAAGLSRITRLSYYSPSCIIAL